jgi:tRNA pseudouridine55 synthase
VSRRRGGPAGQPAASGLVVIDKPAGWTSHDVVARVRRLAGTRRVGHAGTLDPMATGVLLVGVERATRLLGHLALADKDYLAQVRLGATTVTDDAEGEVLTTTPAAHLELDQVRAAMAELTGSIMQAPAAVSAIKVGGDRAYARVRAGERVELEARPVTVAEFALRRAERVGDFLDLDVAVTCSTGTYVRALARDLGAALGVGGHLTELRRTRVGGYSLAGARTLDQLEEAFTVLPLAQAAAEAFPRRDVDAESARVLGHGGWLPAAGEHAGPIAVFGPDGAFVALVTQAGGRAKPLAVFAPADA